MISISCFPTDSHWKDFMWKLKKILKLKVFFLIYVHLGFPNSSVDNESACDAGDPSSIPGLGRSSGKGVGYSLQYSWASLVAQLVKNLSATGRPGFDPWAWKIPCRKRLPTPVFWPGEFHGLCSPWGHREGNDRVTFNFTFTFAF